MSEDLTVDEIFKALGPAQELEDSPADQFPFGCPSGVQCWKWSFTNGMQLAIPVEANPEAKPRRFSMWLVDCPGFTMKHD